MTVFDRLQKADSEAWSKVTLARLVRCDCKDLSLPHRPYHNHKNVNDQTRPKRGLLL